MNLTIFLLKQLAHVSPGAVARFYASRFCTPSKARRGEDFLEFADLAGTESGCRFFEWGAGPAVLCVHGWGGGPAQFRGLVAPLTAMGYKVVLWEAPAHGASPQARTSLPEIADKLAEFTKGREPFAAVIAHSLGGPATQIAFTKGLRARRYIRISAPHAIPDVFRRFTDFVRLPDRAAAAFRATLERHAGVSAETLGRRPVMVPTLVLHSRDDQQVPLSDSDAFVRANPSARLVVLEGLGHRRILADASVIRLITKELEIPQTRERPDEFVANDGL